MCPRPAGQRCEAFFSVERRHICSRSRKTSGSVHSQRHPAGAVGEPAPVQGPGALRDTAQLELTT